MAVVGRMKDEPSQSDKGANLLGIAYAKAAEMGRYPQRQRQPGSPSHDRRVRMERRRDRSRKKRLLDRGI